VNLDFAAFNIEYWLYYKMGLLYQQEKGKRVLLINPKTISKKSILYDLEAIAPPLGLMYIAAVLEKKFSVRIMDENVSTENMVDIIKDFNPDFVGIGVNFSYQLSRSVELAKIIKNNCDQTKIVMGGNHITFVSPASILDKYSFVDFLILGDGEYVMLNLISGMPLNKIDGLAYRDNNMVKHNGTTRIYDLDKLPFPARHLVDMKKYRIHPFEYTHHHNSSFITSRGCAFPCINCIGLAEKYRVRSPENVVQEMKSLYKDGIRDLSFYDPCFTLNMERAEKMKICDLMIKEKLKFNWCCQTRVDVVNEKLLKKMKKAGCTSIFYGIETGNDKLMEQLKKKIKFDQVKKSIDLTKAAKIKVYGGFMIGHPNETKEDFKQLVEYSKSLNIDCAWFNIVTPFPGTELWEMTNRDKNDLDVLENLSLYSGDISFMDKDYLENCLSEAVRAFYLRPKIIFNLLLDMLTRGTLKRRMDLFRLLFLKNPFLKSTIMQFLSLNKIKGYIYSLRNPF